jgi:hypothetical protein
MATFIFLLIVFYVPCVILIVLSLIQEKDTSLRKVEPFDIVLGVVGAMIPVVNLILFIFCAWFLWGFYGKKISRILN